MFTYTVTPLSCRQRLAQHNIGATVDADKHIRWRGAAEGGRESLSPLVTPCHLHPSLTLPYLHSPPSFPLHFSYPLPPSPSSFPSLSHFFPSYFSSSFHHHSAPSLTFLLHTNYTRSFPPLSLLFLWFSHSPRPLPFTCSFIPPLSLLVPSLPLSLVGITAICM